MQISRSRHFEGLGARRCTGLCGSTSGKFAAVGGAFIKGKSAIRLARVYGERSAISSGRASELEGSLSLVVGRAEATIRAYIRKQEQEEHEAGPVEFGALSGRAKAAPAIRPR